MTSSSSQLNVLPQLHKHICLTKVFRRLDSGEDCPCLELPASVPQPSWEFGRVVISQKVQIYEFDIMIVWNIRWQKQI